MTEEAQLLPLHEREWQKTHWGVKNHLACSTKSLPPGQKTTKIPQALPEPPEGMSEFDDTPRTQRMAGWAISTPGRDETARPWTAPCSRSLPPGELQPIRIPLFHPQRMRKAQRQGYPARRSNRGSLGAHEPVPHPRKARGRVQTPGQLVSTLNVKMPAILQVVTLVASAQEYACQTTCA